DPFPVQNQTPAGMPTLHDRMLAMARVAVVNIDRLHVDPASGILVDDVALAGGTPVRGTVLSTSTAAYTPLALRTTRRALDGLLTLYSNTKPDEQGVPSPLDAFPAIDGKTHAAELDQLIDDLSGVFLNKLSTG